MRKNSKPVMALFGALALCGIILSSCSKPAADAGGRAQGASAGQAGSAGQGAPGAAGGRRQAAITVQATVAAMGQLSADRDTAGVVGPVVQSQVATQVAGTVLKVPRLSGDWVKAGDIVVQLDDAQLKLSLANAQATLDNARINLSVGQDSSTQASPKLALQVQSAQSALDSARKFYDSQKALYDLGGISASALDTARSQLQTAQANLEGAKTSLDQNGKADDQTIAQLKLAVSTAQNQVAQAQLNLQYASIRAPFAGQLAAINVQPGMYVSLNTPAFTLVSGEKQISFNVSPPDAPSLALGTTIGFEYGGRSYPIRVKQAPSAPVNGVVPLTATPASGVSLPFGTVGNISYSVPLAKGILVPLSSLETLENQNYVFTIVGGKVATKSVKIVAEAGIIAAVEGLASGDVVVVSPPPGLIPGSQVQSVMIGAGAGAPAAQAPQAATGGGKAPAASAEQAQGQRGKRPGAQGAAPIPAAPIPAVTP